MPELERALSVAAYALFALEQPLSLEEIATGARTGAFPAAATHTPEWFAAAAEGMDLHVMAPELQVLPSDDEVADLVDVTGIDLIHVYAPEFAAASLDSVDDTDESEKAEEDAQPVPPKAAKPGAATQIGLLKELGGLDD